MNYTAAVQTAASVLFILWSAVFAHFIVFALIGLFCKKRYPEVKEKGRYGLIIPARNEEAVVASLIESIRKNDYPQDKLHIFVVAHNCTDRTADVARKAGATVYEYNNPREGTMGYAIKYLFSRIERDYGTQTYDGFFLFNADNILDKDYFSRMNDAFLYYNKECVITSFRNSKNMGKNLISGLYGMYFMVGCRMECRGRTVAGCSTRVQGTGYLIGADIVKDGWKYTTLAEDWEFTADQVLLSHNIRFCDDAVFYDEQPTGLRIMWRQRVRWSRGHLIVFFTRIKELVRALFAKDTSNRLSVYDITANILPPTIMLLILQTAQIVLLLFAPLIDKGTTLKEVFFGTTFDLLRSTGLIFGWLRSGLMCYLTTLLSAIIIFLVERKRVKGVSFPLKILIALFWPLFLGIQFPIDIQAIAGIKSNRWDPIPHNDKTTFDSVNGTKT